MSTNSTASLGLKRLREQAGLSVREVAAALGQSPSSYAYYENDYKKTYLPVELANALAPILRDRGTPPIGEQQVLALGGANSLWVIKPTFTERPGPKSKIEIETDMFTEVLVGVGREAEALGLDLSSEQQSRLVAEICRRVSNADSARQPWILDWEIKHACRFIKAFLQ